jgi:hypothetical protein
MLGRRVQQQLANGISNSVGGASGAANQRLQSQLPFSSAARLLLRTTPTTSMAMTTPAQKATTATITTKTTTATAMVMKMMGAKRTMVVTARNMQTRTLRMSSTPEEDPTATTAQQQKTSDLRDHLDPDKTVTAPAPISEAEYHQLADAFMEELVAKLEKLQEQHPDMEVEHSVS